MATPTNVAFQETFSTNPVSTTTIGTSGTGFVVSGGEINLASPATSISSPQNYIWTKFNGDLTGQHGWSIKIRQLGTGRFNFIIGSSTSPATTYRGSGARPYWSTTGTNIRAGVLDSGGSLNNNVTLPYDPVAMAYLRFWYDDSLTTYSTYTFVWDYSSDNTNWTVVNTITNSDISGIGSWTPENTGISIAPTNGTTSSTVNCVKVDVINPSPGPAETFQTIAIPAVALQTVSVYIPPVNVILAPIRTWAIPQADSTTTANGASAYVLNFDYTKTLLTVAPDPVSTNAATTLEFVVNLSDSAVFNLPLVRGELTHIPWAGKQLDKIGHFSLDCLSTKPASALMWGAPETFQTWYFDIASSERSFLKWNAENLPTGGKISLPCISTIGAYANPTGEPHDLGISLPQVYAGAYSWLLWDSVDPGKPDPTKEKTLSLGFPTVTTRNASAINIPVVNGYFTITTFPVLRTGLATAGTVQVGIRYPPKGDANTLGYTLTTLKMDISLATNKGMDIRADYHDMTVELILHQMDIDIETESIEI